MSRATATSARPEAEGASGAQTLGRCHSIAHDYSKCRTVRVKTMSFLSRFCHPERISRFVRPNRALNAVRKWHDQSINYVL